MTESSLRTIPIEQLCIGMFITELDIPWLDSPFLTHNRLIKKQEEIEALRESGVKELTVDISRGISPCEKPPNTTHATAHGKPLRPEGAKTPQTGLPKPVERVQRKTSFDQELQAAFVLRSKIRRSLEGVYRSFELNAPIEAEDFLPYIDNTLDSLARNNQALMSLVHLSRKAQRIADHAFGAFCLTLNLALVLEVRPRQREQLALAALLHEAGWMQLPLHLMGKRTRYLPTEEKLVQQHTALGEKMLQASGLSELTLRIVAEHHERLDGSGYPRRLRQEQIHSLSQIFAVVDLYEERVHRLTDQPAMVPINAMRSLYRDGEQGRLNGRVVAAFISMLGVYPATTAVLLNTGEKAVVVHSHAEAHLAPVVDIHYDRSGKVLNVRLRVDLSAQGSAGARLIEKAIDPGAPGIDPARRLSLTEDELA